MKNTYEDVAPMTREDAWHAFMSNMVADTVRALLSVTHHESDRQWVEDRCFHFLDSPIPEVRKTAILCIGYLARIHGQVDRARVLPALNKLRADPEYAGVVEDAVDDIEMFTQDAE